ncbi:acyltransferase family protein [Ruminiclostridium papyrosolvens]|uniref:Acyltransferase n=1 Tax=Ruminiclostridium papyrosolvens C7 TaxID=1330534 RepID=U4R0W0_9FIRM|nr:acyltransferase [Ruminiclostridium papyrosolvens]EPR10388.1 acyltransferase [Ruminiclostridium papyrosolvens C7]
MISIYVVLAVILLFGVKVRIRGWDDGFLSLSNTKMLQGFCAVLIIIHHISQILSDSKQLSFFNEYGVLFVGIFFFCSGYGLIKSFKTKDNYMQGFIGRRLPSVLVPFYITTFIYMAIILPFNPMPSLLQTILLLTGVQLINPHAWYIVAVVIFYIAFYFIFKYIKNEKTAFASMAIFIVCYIVSSIILRHGPWWLQGEWWYNTCFLFYIGMLIARFENRLTAIVKKYYAVIFPLAIAAFAVMYKVSNYTIGKFSYYAQTETASGYPESLICFFTQLPAVILFVAVVFILCMKITFSNIILRFLSKISLELYLIHYLFLLLYKSDIFLNITNDLLYVTLVVISSVAMAFLLHIIDKPIIRLITPKGGKTSGKGTFC